MNLLLIFFDCVLCVIALKGILVPKQFLAGGLTGLSLLVHYSIPSLPLGLIYFILNIPMFVIGWLFAGRRLFFHSLAYLFFRPLFQRDDPEAFVVDPETLEVMGKRIGNRPHW